MPLYEYECPECGSRFGRLRPIREMDEAAPCPRCGSERPRRVLSLVAAPKGCGPSG